jgi:tetratricopeptide (TPR) repeat protein
MIGGYKIMMDFKIYKKFFIFITIVIFSTASLWAQAGHGRARISGVVVDENNEGIPSAQIVCEFIKNPQVKQTTSTDKKGEWAILGLGTGMFKVTASKEGYIAASTEIYVRQLERNPKVELTLKKTEAERLDIKGTSSLDLIDQANLLYDEQKYDQALSLLQQFLEENPDAYQTYASIGDCYREMGEFEPAIENYQKVLEEADKDKAQRKEMASKALAGIGESYLKMQDLEQAQSYFEQSLEVYPENEILAYNVGEIYFANQNIDQAIKYFTISTEIKPDWPPPYLKLGYVYLNKGDFENAEASFKKFLELDPDSPEAPTVKRVLEFLAEKKD